MSNLKSRLDKLEAALNPDVEDLHIMRFIIDCECKPIGYRCGDIEIMRRHDESENEFKSRCAGAVVWPGGHSRHIFKPIYEPGQI
jgi:hypothetical protein